MGEIMQEDLAARLQALEDRIEIEALFTDYFNGLEIRGGLGGFFTDDIELDVEGKITRGLATLMESFPRAAASFPKRIGQLRMQLTNFIIKVDGDKATAHFIMTQELNDTIKGVPRFTKQSRDFDWLVRVDGQWKIRKRVVIADSGLYDGQEDTWSRRDDFSFETAQPDQSLS